MSRQIAAEADEIIFNEYDRTILELPLSDYLRLLIEYICRLRESDFFHSRKPEEYRTLEFYAARFCKAHPDLIELDAYTATRAVEDIMMSFEDMPEGENPWESYFGADDGDECCSRFEAAWDSVRFIPFQSILESAVRLAIAHPL